MFQRHLAAAAPGRPRAGLAPWLALAVCALLPLFAGCTAPTANVGELTPDDLQNERGWRYYDASEITLSSVENLCLTECAGLAVVAWRESILATDGVHSRLRVVSAEDSLGKSWSDLRSAWASFSPTPYASDLALASIGGRPALSFYAVDSAGGGNELLYLPAEDNSGMLWGEPERLAATGSAQLGVELLEVAGEPALIYTANQGNSHRISYLRRESAAAGWGTALPLFVGEGVAVSEASLALISGNPAICFAGQHSIVVDGQAQLRSNLSYSRAEDSLGSSWTDPVILDLSPGAGELAQLAQIGSRPAVYYRVEPPEPAPYNPYEMRYLPGLDPNGFEWATPRFLGIGNGYRLVDVGGRAFASNVVIPEQSLLGGQPYLTGRISNDGSGEQWSEAALLGYSPRATVNDLEVINGLPAIVYVEEGRLIYASFHF